jgi:hypothetical protein
MKYIRVTMPDGSDWQVPASLVAEPRARYYAEHDTGQTEGEDFEVAFRTEVRNVVAADLIDWAQNNMNWEDVQANAVMVLTPDSHVDYQEGWVNGEMRVVDQ